MATVYIDTPHNFAMVETYVIFEKTKIISEILGARKCFFYDTCSFRKHANITNLDGFFSYLKHHEGIIIITQCVLMELASQSGELNEEYINYFKKIYLAGLKVLIMREEYVFEIMNICFSANSEINRYLSWAVRLVKHPTSTITETLKQDISLNNSIIKQCDLTNKFLYQQFFSAVRGNKESGDNLGEELIAICLHILSYLVGEPDGKFCVITEDKGAISMINQVFEKTNSQYKGKKIIIYSTPKLVQHMYNEKKITERSQIEAMLNSRDDSNKIVILGTELFDIKNREISISVEELTEKIMTPNSIHIIY